MVPRQDQYEPAATAMLQPVREGEVDMTALLRAGHDHESLIIGEIGETFRAMRGRPRPCLGTPISVRSELVAEDGHERSIWLIAHGEHE